MKKIIILLIGFLGFLNSNVSAQACCSSVKECKPKICCPTKPNCCKDTKSLTTATTEHSAENTNAMKATNSLSSSNPQHPIKDEENLNSAIIKD